MFNMKNRVFSLYDVVPLLLKPTHLGWYPSMYNYFGYLPDAGTSYGCYACDNKAHVGVVKPLDTSSPFCTECGNQMNYKDSYKLDDKDLDTINTGLRGFNILPRCEKCNAEYLTNIDFSNIDMPTVYCTSCGNDITNSINNYKTLVTNNAQRSEVLTMKRTTAFEVLALNKLPQKLTTADVRMHLYGEQTENPYWNVDVAGVPVGRISLMDQENPESLRSVFTSAHYSDGITKAICQAGLVNIFTQQNGKFWKAELNETTHQKKVRASIETSLKKEHEEKVEALYHKSQNLANELIKRVALVLAGMDKNFYNKTGHPLKSALFDSFANSGVHPSTILGAIEEGFAHGATRFFGEVMDKAVDYMGYTDEALDEIGNAISDGATIEPVLKEEVYEEGPEGDELYMEETVTPVYNTPSYDAPVDLGFPTAGQPMAARMAKANFPFANRSDNNASMGSNLKSSIKAAVILGGANTVR